MEPKVLKKESSNNFIMKKKIASEEDNQNKILIVLQGPHLLPLSYMALHAHFIWKEKLLLYGVEVLQSKGLCYS